MRVVDLPEGRPALMGILNVTPDSFSDGRQYLDQQSAVQAGLRMMDEGADLIDVGGESTRPGSEGVPTEEELRRVLPVVKALSAQGVTVSIDTSKAAVARECLRAGAAVVNDVTALSDGQMAAVCAEAKCAVCLMHMKGTPRTMQMDPQYEDVVEEVRELLLCRARKAEEAGIEPSRIWLDPGFGFGKTVRHNLELLGGIRSFVQTGYPILVGVSRKSFLGKLLAGDSKPLPVTERLEATLAAQTIAQVAGVRIIRAHDVRASRRAIDLTAAVLAASANTAGSVAIRETLSP